MVSVILFSGCNTDPRFMTYNKNSPAASTAMLDKKIIVLPFTDCRPERFSRILQKERFYAHGVDCGFKFRSP